MLAEKSDWDRGVELLRLVTEVAELSVVEGPVVVVVVTVVDS